jgi:hypothetical protein
VSNEADPLTIHPGPSGQLAELGTADLRGDHDLVRPAVGAP